MKRIVLLAAALSCLCTATAQTPAPGAAERIGAMIGRGDYEALGEALPQCEESLPPALGTMARALVAYHRGQPRQSNAAIRLAIDNHADELGEQAVLGLVALQVYNSRTLNDYASALEAVRRMQAALPGQDASLAGFARWMEAFVRWPATRVRRPEGEVLLPAQLRRAGRGEHLTLEVRMNDRCEPFIFDTGCSGSNFISAAAARRLGVRIVADSIPVSGVATLPTRVGVADSLCIGPITVLHPTFIVADSLPRGSGPEALCEAVLGTDIIRALGEVRVEARKGRIVLPAAPSPAPARANLSFAEGQYYLHCEGEGEPLRFHFDTGNVKSTLGSSYFASRSEAIRRRGRRGTSTEGGFGGVREVEVYTLPAFRVRMPDREAVLRDVTVRVEGKGLFSEREDEAGSLGVDLLRACDAVTIDLQRMFVRTE